VSARLETLLDHQRLQDCLRNDLAMGIAAPGPELDDAYFRRVDATQPSADELARRREAVALELQINRENQS
jgi:hypothetical protein